MVRTSIVVLILSFLLATNALAGLGSSFYSSGYDGGGVVVTAVDIKDKGIYNLVISVNFLRKPKQGKIYKSDEYEDLIEILMIESRGIILQKVLESKELQITDFLNLKNSIQAEIEKRVKELKNKFLLEKDADVIFSLSNFFLLEPKEK